jgi:hypothetical protein
MKPIAISSCLALAAFSLFAADQKPAKKKEVVPQPAGHIEMQLSAPQAASANDSPLVRAAKATNRMGKHPSQVITNDTLVRQGGHFTTADTQQPLPSVPKAAGAVSFAQMEADVQRHKTEAIAAAELAKKNEEQKKTAAAHAASVSEGDTAEIFGEGGAASSGPPQSMKPTTPAVVPVTPTPQPVTPPQ